MKDMKTKSAKTNSDESRRPKKKTMSYDQVGELEGAENALLAFREEVANRQADVAQSVQDAREIHLHLKKEMKLLAKSAKGAAAAKKKFDKLKAKYKGWAKPKTDAYPETESEPAPHDIF